MYRAYNIDISLGQAALEDFSLPKKSKFLTPDQWAERVYILKHWETGIEGKISASKFKQENRVGYNWKKNHRVETTPDGTDILYRKVATKQTTIQGQARTKLQVVHIYNTFDIIRECHFNGSHLKVVSTHNRIKEKYYNISEREVKCFIDLCYSCGKAKLKLQKLEGAVKSIRSNSFHERFQVDLVDYREDPQTNVYGVICRWLLVVKDHFTRLSYLVPIPRKEAKFVAHELYHIFGLLGYPLILQSDNGKSKFSIKLGVDDDDCRILVLAAALV